MKKQLKNKHIEAHRGHLIVEGMYYYSEKTPKGGIKSKCLNQQK